MHKRVRAFTLAISLCHIGFANAQTISPSAKRQSVAIAALPKKYRNMLEYMATAYGIVAVGMIAPVSSVPSKMLKTTLKKQFLDIARSVDSANDRADIVKGINEACWIGEKAAFTRLS